MIWSKFSSISILNLIFRKGSGVPDSSCCGAIFDIFDIFTCEDEILPTLSPDFPRTEFMKKDCRYI